MSLTRSQYQQVFNFARRMFYQFQSRDETLEFDACEIMQMVEEVIGQQSTFPPEAREILEEENDDNANPL